jgi:hypothetical protein
MSVIKVVENNQRITVTDLGNRTIVLQSIGVQGIQGPIGPQGIAGPNEIGGYGFDIDGLSTNDLLQFKGSAWENVPQETIVDGGNF